MTGAVRFGDAGELFYESLIARYVDDDPRFVERPWLASRIRDHLADSDCRFVLVCGAPGTGKTALAAWLARTLSLAPRYFIRRDSRTPLSAGDSRSFLVSVGHQLAVLRPEAMRPEGLSINVRQRVDSIAAGGRVTAIRVGELVVSPFHETAMRVDQAVGSTSGELLGLDISRLVTHGALADPEQLAGLALFAPAMMLAVIEPDALIVVLVDALDELRHRIGLRAGGETVLDWLASCPRLPDNIRFVLTSRPDGDLLERFRLAQEPWLREQSIHATEQAVRADLETYADRALHHLELAPALRRRLIDRGRFVARLAEKAEGNFQYLVAWSRAVEHAAISGREADLDELLHLDALPSGLEGIYRYFLTLIRDAAERRPTGVGAATTVGSWDSVHRPLLGILSVAQSPLSTAQLAWLADADTIRNDLADALDDLRQFLETDGVGHRLFHSSMAELLTADATRTMHPHWYIDPGDSHQRIAQRLLSRYGGSWSACTDDYALTYTTLHLVESVRRSAHRMIQDQLAAELLDLISDHEFNFRRLARLGAETVVNDFLIVFDALANRRPDASAAVSRALAQLAVTDSAADQPLLDAGTLHSLMVYRQGSQTLYELVLDLVTASDLVTDLVPDAERHKRVLRGFLQIQGSRYRLRGDAASLQRARQLLESAVSSAPSRLELPDLKVGGSLWYELAYLHYLVGNVEAAAAAFRRSAELSARAGDTTGHYISRSLELWVLAHAGPDGRAALRTLTREALVHFESQAQTSQHARRWVMNAHSNLFELAYLEGDADEAASQLELLDADPWVRAFARTDLLDQWHARLDLIRGNWHAACDRYALLLADELGRAEPSEREGLAQDLVDYGRALAGTGQTDEAHRVWRQALRCPDHAANWPWKPLAAQQLGA